jgi:xylulokinase
MLLGLDVGTLGVKGVVVTEQGAVLARARRGHVARHPQAGWSEHSAEADWWADAAAVIRDVLQASGVDSSAITAIGVSGLTPCLLPLDANGWVLRPAVLYSDNRALAQLAAANAVLPAPLTAQAVIPKWRWVVENEPAVAHFTSTLLSSHNYVVYCLTGALSMDYDTASIMGGVFDSERREWDQERCVLLGVDPKLLSPLYPVTSVVGGVTHAAAADTGLRVGTPVIAGTGDTFATLVGCGAVSPGDAMISLGTTGLLTLTTRSLEVAAAGPHFEGASSVGRGDEGAVLWAANLLACGGLLAWYRDTLAGSMAATVLPSYDALDALAARVPPGADGLVVLPHLMGRRTPTADPAMRGVLFGLTLAHDAHYIYRGLLEAVGYALRRGYEPVAGRITRVVATGGGAGSTVWRQILADILETPIEFHAAASGALGSAFLAGYGIGILPSFDALAGWLAQPVLTLPQPANTPAYRRLYETYCALDDTLSPLFGRLNS